MANSLSSQNKQFAAFVVSQQDPDLSLRCLIRSINYVSGWNLPGSEIEFTHNLEKYIKSHQLLSIEISELPLAEQIEVRHLRSKLKQQQVEWVHAINLESQFFLDCGAVPRFMETKHNELMRLLVQLLSTVKYLQLQGVGRKNN